LTGESMHVTNDLIVREACKQPTLAEALSYAATIENERAVKQALENHKNGTRDPHTGQLWETCFRYTFERVLEAWFKTHDVVGEIGRLEVRDAGPGQADVRVRPASLDVGGGDSLSPLAQTAADQRRLNTARQVKKCLDPLTNIRELDTPHLDQRLAQLYHAAAALQSTDEPQMTPAGTEIAALLEEFQRDFRRCEREWSRRERLARGEIVEAVGDLAEED